jgi:alanine racemase
MTINGIASGNSSEVRPTYVEVNLARISGNLASIKTKVAPAKVMPIIKANAYGHGLIEVAENLAEQVDCVGVAILEEGIFLREKGFTKPILVLGSFWDKQLPKFIQYNLTLTASTVEHLEQINTTAETMHRKAKVHIKVDTGMGRVGAQYYDADAADLTHARLQVERFNEVLQYYERKSLPAPLRHMANSGGILQIPEAAFDLVRPGILMYGVYPSIEVQRSVAVKPALAWKSRAVYSKGIKPRHPVSYGSTWQSDHITYIATVPVGYGDGYFRSMSNKAQVIIHGERYPQVGNICMDMMMINVKSGTIKNGDEIILIGEQERDRITVAEMATWAGTIPYEILTNINTRVPRIYFTGSTV